MINIGVIGYGYWGPNLVRNFADLEGATMAAVADLDPKKLDISLQQNLLTVAGERKVQPSDKGSYYRQERFSGEFRRAVTLPEDVDPDGVDARYRDGVLQISVRRRESTRPRQIQIN